MYGKTIKKIRKMKGLTQKEVYTGVASKHFIVILKRKSIQSVLKSLKGFYRI